jgi:transcription initiation factor TFIIA large subunit
LSSSQVAPNTSAPSRTTHARNITQLDGNGIIIDLKNNSIKVNFHQLDGNSPTVTTTAAVDSRSQAQPNEDDLLGSDLDDEEDDNEASIETENIILCQYDKASRTKSKWKCSLKDGLVHVNGQDYAFHRAAGEFEWI